MNKIFILALLSVLTVAIITAQNPTESPKNEEVAPASLEEELQWKLYKEKHQKKYRTALREARRKQAFLTNLRKVRQDNKNGMADDDITHNFRINKFADWTEDELKSLTGEIDTDDVIPGPEMDRALLRSTVPDSVDLRGSPCMPPVKYQGDCGSCYTFAAVTTIEYGRCMRTGQLTLLSEEHLLDCSQRYGNAGCSGGLALRAFNYVRDFGIERSETYPYEGEETVCQYRAEHIGANVTGWAYATTTTNEEAMKVAVATYGPLAVSVDANDWQFYSGGVYSNPRCTTRTNHAVVIVGYGTDEATNKPFWIIRNSWGKDWGLKGYILLERGVNRCGVARRVVYPFAR